MLTINIKIDDAQTEQRLLEESRTSGKSVDALVKALVDEQFANADELAFGYRRLDVRKHARIINNVLTEEEKAKGSIGKKS